MSIISRWRITIANRDKNSMWLRFATLVEMQCNTFFSLYDPKKTTNECENEMEIVEFSCTTLTNNKQSAKWFSKYKLELIQFYVVQCAMCIAQTKVAKPSKSDFIASVWSYYCWVRGWPHYLWIVRIICNEYQTCCALNTALRFL